MKKFKSLISVLMALIMVAMCLTGCGGGGTSATSDVTDSNKENEDAQVFTIAKTAYYSDSDPWNEDDEYGEAIRQMLSEIEGEYNIRIEIDYYSPTEFASIAQTSITNGDTGFADLMICNLFSFGPLYAQGLLMEMGNLSGLDTSSDIWSDAVTGVATFKDGLYGIGSLGLTGMSGSACYYNKDMVKSLGLEDPTELVRRGEWTWDKFREYSLKAVKDMNNDGNFTEADRFGCTSQAYDGLVPLWLTAGVDTITRNSEGNLTYNMLSNEAVTALQKLKNTITINDGMFYSADLDGLTQQAQFHSGNSMFLLGGWTVEAELSGEFEIGVIPYPKYNSESNYLAPSYHNANIICVPAINENTELIGKVLQIMGEKSKDFRTMQIEDDSIEFVDRDTYTEMFTDYIDPGFSLDYFTIMLNTNESISIGTMRAIAMPLIGDTTYSQYTESNSTVIQSLLDEMFNNG